MFSTVCTILCGYIFVRLFKLERARIQLVVFALLRYKLFVVAPFDNFAVFENHYRLAVSYG